MKQNWEIKKLSEIGKVFNGNSINEKVKKDNYTGLDEGLPFIATKDVGFDSIIDYENGVKIPFTEKEQFKIAPANTSLICAEGGSAGRKIGFTNQDVCFGNKLFALVPYKNVDSKFLFYYYFSSSFQKYFSTEMTGIIGGVSMNKFKDIEIPLPPLPEQQRIVSILDECFVAIAKAKANAEQNLKNAKELFESYLQGVFEKKGDGWKEMKLGEVVSKIMTGPFGSMLHQSDYVEGGIPVVNPQNIVDGKIIPLSKTMINQDTFSRLAKYALILGDIVIARRGEMGRCAVVRQENVNWLCGTGSFVIRVNQKKTDSNFLNVILSSSSTKQQLEKSSIGATMSNLNQTILSELPIRIPSVEQQQTIVRQLDALQAETQKLEAIYQQKLLNLDELKKSVLQKAFAGELKTSKALVL